MEIINGSIILSYDEWLTHDILAGIDHEAGLCNNDIWEDDWIGGKCFISSGKTRQILSILSEYHEMY